MWLLLLNHSSNSRNVTRVGVKNTNKKTRRGEEGIKTTIWGGGWDEVVKKMDGGKDVMNVSCLTATFFTDRARSGKKEKKKNNKSNKAVTIYEE